LAGLGHTGGGASEHASVLTVDVGEKRRRGLREGGIADIDEELVEPPAPQVGSVIRDYGCVGRVQQDAREGGIDHVEARRKALVRAICCRELSIVAHTDDVQLSAKVRHVPRGCGLHVAQDQCCIRIGLGVLQSVDVREYDIPDIELAHNLTREGP